MADTPRTPSTTMSSHKLRSLAATGQGEALLPRLFAPNADPSGPQPRHVIDLSDVTRGLGLDAPTAERVQRVVSGTNVTFTTKGRSQRLVHGRGRLVEFLRASSIDSDVRQELERRALSYWRTTQHTDLQREARMQLVVKSESFFQKSEGGERTGHKYLRRVPNGKGHYNYVYQDKHGNEHTEPAPKHGAKVSLPIATHADGGKVSGTTHVDAQQFGDYAIHKRKWGYSVTHVPTGSLVDTTMGDKKSAIAYVKHLDEHAGGLFQGVGFGGEGLSYKNESHKADMEKFRNVKHAYGKPAAESEKPRTFEEDHPEIPAAKEAARVASTAAIGASADKNHKLAGTLHTQAAAAHRIAHETIAAANGPELAVKYHANTQKRHMAEAAAANAHYESEAANTGFFGTHDAAMRLHREAALMYRELGEKDLSQKHSALVEEHRALEKVKADKKKEARAAKRAEKKLSPTELKALHTSVSEAAGLQPRGEYNVSSAAKDKFREAFKEATGREAEWGDVNKFGIAHHARAAAHYKAERDAQEAERTTQRKAAEAAEKAASAERNATVNAALKKPAPRGKKKDVTLAGPKGFRETVPGEHFGDFAVHASAHGYTVTHAPTGHAAFRTKSKRQAAEYAKHMSTHAAGLLHGVGLGGEISGSGPHAAEMDKLREAHNVAQEHVAQFIRKSLLVVAL